MTASASIQILPGNMKQEDRLKVVDEVIKYIKSTGLNCYVSPFDTTVEGENFDQIIAIISEAHKVAVKAGCDSVSSSIRIVYRPKGGVLTIDEKVSKHNG